MHHGNGTQEIFGDDPRVLLRVDAPVPVLSGHRRRAESGEGEGKGFTVNVPLTAGGGDGVYRAAFERVILPVLEEYRPQLVLVSAGFDASARDPLAEMTLSADAFGWMARALRGVADKSAEGRIAIVLEGGYDLVALEAGLLAATRGIVEGTAVDIARDADTDDIARASKVAGRSVEDRRLSSPALNPGTGNARAIWTVPTFRYIFPLLAAAPWCPGAPTIQGR